MFTEEVTREGLTQFIAAARTCRNESTSTWGEHELQVCRDSDVGLRATDRDSHYPCHLWLRNVSSERTYKRSAEGWAHVQAKKQHKKEVLQAKKKAQKNIGAIRAWVETFKEVSPRKGWVALFPW